MKTKWMKKALYLVLSTTFIASTIACNSDDEIIDQPKVNPTESKIIKPASVEINIYDGHLHGVKKFHQNTHAKELKYLGKTYKLTYFLINGKWQPKSDNEAVNLLADTTPIEQASEVGGGVVAFDIHYFDENHNEITSQCIENNENKHYQHFFVASDMQSGYADMEKKEIKNGIDFFGYEYCDTDPWNQTNHSGKAKFVEDELAVGMKGYFHFLTPYKNFNLNIMLMRAENKLVNGKVSPFYLPSEKQLKNNEWLPSIVVPINLYLSTADLELDAEDLDEETILEREESEFSDADKRRIRALMDAFGIKDFHQAVAEFFWNISGESGHDMNNFWF